MCDPLTIAGMALAAGASGYSAYSQNQAQERAGEARRRVMEAERARQAELQRQASANMAQATDAVNKTTDPREMEKAQEQRRTDLAQVNQSPAVSVAPAAGGPSSAPQIVQTEIGRKAAEAVRRNSERTTRTANIGAYSDQFGNQARVAGGAGRNIATVSDFAQGWSRILPLELQAATTSALNRGATGRMIADVVGAIGGGMTQAGAQGMGPSFGSLFGGRSVPNTMFTEFSMYPGR